MNEEISFSRPFFITQDFSHRLFSSSQAWFMVQLWFLPLWHNCWLELCYWNENWRSCDISPLKWLFYARLWKPKIFAKFAKVMFSQVSVCPRSGACVAGGHARQGSMRGRGGHAWHTHPCHARSPDMRSMCGRYASYWNAFLFVVSLTLNVIPHLNLILEKAIPSNRFGRTCVQSATYPFWCLE